MNQVNELIHRAVADIIAREIELAPNIFITVTHVDIARDLKTGLVYITVLPDNKRGTALRLLHQQQGYLQKLLGQRVRLKSIPHLTIELDTQEMKAQHIYDILDRPNA